MSLYSGKCDLGDHFYSHREHCDSEDLREELARTNIYIGTNVAPLRIDTYKDLLPYEPYIMSICAYSKFADQKNTIRLTTKSWVDIEEDQILEGYHKQLLTIYNRCKRNKEQFDPQKAAEDICVFKEPESHIVEIANRVAEKGNKSTFKGVYIERRNKLYRDPLYSDMIAAGYSEEQAKSFVYNK